MHISWIPYQPQGIWSAKYRVVGSILEVELETVSRLALESDFALDVEKQFPIGYRFELEDIKVNVKDTHMGEQIFLGSRIPTHWKRSISIVVPIVPQVLNYA